MNNKNVTKSVLLFLALYFLAGNSYLFAKYIKVYYIRTENRYGNCVYVELPNGKNILYDGGNEDATPSLLSNFLDSKIGAGGVIWFMVLTHAHSDHLYGLNMALDRYDVKYAYDTKFNYSSGIYDDWKTKIANEGCSYYEVIATTASNTTAVLSGPGTNVGVSELGSYGWDSDVRVKVIGGKESTSDDNPNGRSMVFKLSLGSSTFHFGGDSTGPGSSNQEAWYIQYYPNDTRADVYLVHHHGGGNDTGNPLLDQMDAKYSVIQPGNYDTSSADTNLKVETMQRLVDHKVIIYRTDLDFNVTVIADEKGNYNINREHVWGSDGLSTSHPWAYPPPSIPQSLTVTGVSDNDVSLNWADNPGGDGVIYYDVFFSTMDSGDTIGGTLSQPDDGNPPNAYCTTGIYRLNLSTGLSLHTITGLIAGKPYYSRVSAVNQYGYERRYSNQVSTSTTGGDVTPPSAITNLSALTGTQHGQIDLTWTAPGDDGTTGTAASYVLKYATFTIDSEATFDSASTYSQEWDPLPFGQTEAKSVGGLTSGTTYYFGIRARDDVNLYGGLSNAPVFARAFTDSIAPSAITNLSALTGSERGRIDLKWTSPGDDGNTNPLNPGYFRIDYSTYSGKNWVYTSYKIQISTTNVNPGSSQLYTVTGLSDGVTYYLRLWCGDETPNWSLISNGATTWAQVITDFVPPSAITNLVATTGSNNGEINLTWTAVGDDGTTGNAAGYLVKYATYQILNNSDFIRATTFQQDWTPVAPRNTESKIIGGLTAGVTYYFSIKTHDEIPNYASISNTGANFARAKVSPRTLLFTDEAPSSPKPISALAGITYKSTTEWAAKSAKEELLEPNDVTLTVLSAGTGHYGQRSFVTPELSTQTFLSGTWTFKIWGAEQFLTNNAQWTVEAYLLKTDGTKGTVIVNAAAEGTRTPEPSSAGTVEELTLNYNVPSSINVSEGQKLVVEVILYHGAAPTGDWDKFYYNSTGYKSRVILPFTPVWLDTSDDTPPAAIANLTITEGQYHGGLKLTWTAPGDDGNTGQASGYEVRYATYQITDSNYGSVDTYSQTWTPLSAGNTETKNITGFTPGTTYYIAIKSYDDKTNWSGLSNTDTNYGPAGIDNVPPGAITNLSAQTGSDSGEVNLTWCAPADDGGNNSFGKYEVRYATYSVQLSTTPTWWNNNGANVRWFYNPLDAGKTETRVVTGLTPGNTYYFAAKVYDSRPNISDIDKNAWNWTTQAWARAQTDIVPPATVNTLTALPGSGAGSIQLQWIAVGDDGTTGNATKYLVHYSTISNILSESAFNAANVYGQLWTPEPPGGQEARIITNLTPGVTYYWAIRAVDEVDNRSPIWTNANTNWTYAKPNVNVLYFRNNNAEEPMPNALQSNPPYVSNEDTTENPPLPARTAEISLAEADTTVAYTAKTRTTVGYTPVRIFVTPPLAAQSAPSGNYTFYSWGENSGATTDSRPGIHAYLWRATDNYGVSIGTGLGAEFTFSGPNVQSYTISGPAMTINQGDRICFEYRVDYIRSGSYSHNSYYGGPSYPSRAVLPWAPSWYTVGGDTTPPAAVANLSAIRGGSEGTIAISWTAPGDDGNGGGLASAYLLKYATYNITSETLFNQASEWSQTWTPLEPGQTESKTIDPLTAGVTYYFSIKARDEVPNWAALSNTAFSPAKEAGPAGPSLGVSIDITNYDFNMLQVGISSITASSATVTNNGDLTANWTIRATTNTAGTPWQLSSSADTDKFILWSVFNSTRPVESDFGDEDKLSYNYQVCTSTYFAANQAGTSVPVGENRVYWWKIQMPSVSNTAEQQSILIEINAEAP